MSTRVGSSVDSRKAGLILAGAFAAISGGVVLYFVASGRSSTEQEVSATPPDIGEPTPPDKMSGGASNTGAMGALNSSGWARLQFVDKKDPTRIASEMEWQSLNPDEAQRGRSHITEPRFWIYPEDGSTVHVQARQATVFMPDQQSEPESGRLFGGTVIRIFSAGPDGNRRAVDLEKDVPLALISTDAIDFDTALGEIAAQTACDISTAQVEARFASLRIHVNELQRRLQLLEAGSGSIRYLLSKRDQRPEEPEKPAAQQPGQAAAPVAGAEPAAPPKEDLYRATFAGEVRVAQATRMVGGDALDVWARLLDGAFPPGTFPEQRSEEKPAAARQDDAAAAEPALAAAGQPAGAPSGEPGAQSDEDVVLTWSGTLVVRPIEAAPAELEDDNHLALRFTADTTGHVAFADADAGIDGRCVWIDYRISTQDLVLAGPGPTAVRVNTRGGQEMTVPRLDLNLVSGVGLIRGAGVMHEGERRLNWTDQCDLVFATEDGMMTGLLKEASFRGGVTAKDDRSNLEGDLFRATFVPVRSGDAPAGGEARSQRVGLARLVIEGGAAGTSEEGSLRADKLDVAFEPAPDGGDPEPRIVTAIGNVRAENEDAVLTGDFVETTLGRDDKGDVAVRSMRADGNVTLASEERRVAGGGDQVLYDGASRTARLTAQAGGEAWVSHEGAKVLSPTIDLDVAQGRMAVPGAGTFTHDPDPRARGAVASNPFGGTSIRATWTGSLTADERTGIIECVGDVVATTDPEAPQVYLARAPYLKLELSPAEFSGQPEGSAAADAPSERRLLRAELASGDEENPALVESRTYAAAPAGETQRTLEQFMRLTGGRIIADDTAGNGGVLNVPGPGRAAIFDGRSGAKPTDPDAKPGPADALAGGEFRGSALFTWTGSMDMDRPTGLLNLRRAVRLVHRPLGDEPPTALECERLKATLLFAEKPGAGGAQARAQSAELVRAQALDAVYVESATRKLLADAVLYDAARRLVEATAAEGNRVTLYDEQRATAQSAGKLTWDLASDRIVIDRPSPIVAPYNQR